MNKTKQHDYRPTQSIETLEYIEESAKAAPSVTFEEIPEQAMDLLVDRKLHDKTK